MNRNEKIIWIIGIVIIVILVSSTTYLIVTSEDSEKNTTIEENKATSFENESLTQPTYDKLATELERVQKENQELTGIIAQIIKACNNASADSHKQQNNALEKENEILQQILEKLRAM